MKRLFIFVLCLIGYIPAVSASDLRFGFTNPSFGGSPFNGSFLLSMADKQNQNKPVTEKDDPSSVNGFKKQLEGQLLSTTAGKISKLVTDSENPIDKPVTYNVNDLKIEIIPINPDTGQYQIVISKGNEKTVIDVFNNNFS
jgi:curli production assembly/transport component CsgF